MSGRFFYLIIYTVAFAAFTAACIPHSPEDTENTAYHISHPLLEGRLSGSAGMAKAAGFITGLYRNNGFHPVFGDSFSDEFAFTDENLIINDAWILTGNRRIPAAPLPVTGLLRAEGPAVFGGYCLENDLNRLDIKNKTVVCMRYGPGTDHPSGASSEMSFLRKYENLRSRGASAVVFADSTPEHTVNLSSRDFPQSGPPAVLLPENQFAAALPEYKEIFAKCRTEGHCFLKSREVHMTVSAYVKPRILTGRNTAAWLRNPDRFLPSSVYIMTAHTDHLGRGSFASLGDPLKKEIHYGADDNASGTASLLRAAWKLRQYERQGKLPRNINVLFLHTDAEEHGLYGTSDFINKYINDGKLYITDSGNEADSPGKGIPVAAVINMDMTGNLNHDRGLIIQAKDTADPSWFTALKQAVSSDPFLSDYRIRFINGGLGPSDHFLFYKSGIPVAFFHTGTHSRYHTSGDQFPFLNIRGAEAIGDTAAEAVFISASAPIPPRYRKAGTEADFSDFD